MNKINPLMLLLLSATIFVSSLVLLKQSKEELIQTSSELTEFHRLSNKYQNLKTSWDQKKNTIKLIDKIIKNTRLKNVDKKIEKKRVIIKISNESLKNIDKFINKLLNEKLNILKLNITQNSVELVVGY